MATLSGQKTVAAAGTAERLGSVKPHCAVLVKALPDNTGLVYVGNVSGDVANGNGMPLAAGESLIFVEVSTLAELWVDAAVNGEGVAWIALSV